MSILSSGAVSTGLNTGNDPIRSAASQLAQNVKKWDSLAHPSTYLYGEGLATDSAGSRYVPPANYTIPTRGPLEEYYRVLGKNGYYNNAEFKPQIVVPMTREDIQAAEDKENMSLLKSFHDWICQHYNVFDDPAEAAWLRQHGLNDLYEAWIKENNEIHELKKQYERVQITGPQNLEDFELMWRAEWDPALENKLMGTTGFQKVSAADSKSSFQKGLFNTAFWSAKNKAYENMPGGAGFSANNLQTASLTGSVLPRVGIRDAGSRNAYTTIPAANITNIGTKFGFPKAEV